jgi:16S rRNA (guanine527-N7)-methyltransferase
MVRVGGVLVAQKGADPEQEVADARRAVSLLGGGALSIQRVATLGPDGRPFTAVLCPKQRPCGAAYPREAGTPKKEPL